MIFAAPFLAARFSFSVFCAFFLATCFGFCAPFMNDHYTAVPGSAPRRLRVAALVFVLAWFFVPELRSSIPAWLPFFVLLALEVNFLVLGWRERGAAPMPRGRTPQETDIAEFGGREWIQPELHEVGRYQVWIPEQMEEDEVELTVPRGRGWSLWEAALVLAVVALLLFVFAPDRGWSSLSAAEQTRTEARLSAEAARIAGHPARVHCDAKGEAVGVVQHADGLAEIGGTHAFLTPGICFRLHRLAFDGDEGPFSQTARAVAVLAHEAWHLRGERDEGVTNCYAFQSGVELGRAARPLPRDRGPDDEPAAGRERDPGPLGPRIPRPARVPRRRRPRPRSGQLAVSVSNLRRKSAQEFLDFVGAIRQNVFFAPERFRSALQGKEVRIDESLARCDRSGLRLHGVGAGP